MLWLIRKFLLLLSGEQSSAQLAAGMALGVWLGMLPTDSLVWYLLFLLLLTLRANISMALLFFSLTKLLCWPFLTSLNALGASILNTASLHDFFTRLYNTPWWAISGFNRALCTGGLVAGALAALLVFPLGWLLINLYRKKILIWLEKLWIVRILKGSVFYRWYSTLVA